MYTQSRSLILCSRSYVTRALKPADPLTRSPLAEVYELPSKAVFIARPPPSAVPQNIDLPQPQAEASSSSATPHSSDLSHPLAFLSSASNPASRAHAAANPFPLEHQAPVLRPRQRKAFKQLSEAEIADLRSRRCVGYCSLKIAAHTCGFQVTAIVQCRAALRP